MKTNESVDRYLRWVNSVQRLSARLRTVFSRNQRRLSVGLGVVLFALLGWWFVSWAIRHAAFERARPSRAVYEQRLATTRAMVASDGTIVIRDANGETLSLTINYWKSDGRPAVPFHYELETHYDDVVISPEDDPHNHPYSEADAGMELVPTAALTLQDMPDKTLLQAIDRLVNWSVADAESGAKPRFDIAGSEGYNNYFLRCAPAEGLFYLFLRRYSSSGAGYVIPVTDFRRAHLWRYLLDHFVEIRQLAESYLSAKRGEAPKPGNS